MLAGDKVSGPGTKLQLPHGTVTLLMTDVQSSTSRWERAPEAMRESIELHDRIASWVFPEFAGVILKERGQGDSFFVVFEDSSKAVQAGAAFLKALESASWPDEPIVVRVGIHTGDVVTRDRDYYGPSVNRCARIRDLAQGGQILLSRSVEQRAGGSLPPSLSFRSLGQFRLKGLLEPEEIFQVLGAGLRDKFPMPIGLDAVANNLPSQLNTFVGRDRDMAELKELLGKSRLVTVLGPGGTGKSRLAVQVASEEADRFSAGLWFVPLAGLDQTVSEDQLISTTLGRLDGSQDMSLKAFADSLAADRCLLILDNCEHLLDGIRSMVGQLLEAAPHLTVLTTSRQALGLDAERVYHLQPLSLPPKGAQVAEMSSSDAVLLFADRVQARDASFAVTDRNSDLVRDLVLAVDGLPLAIEFIASHMRSIGPKQILQKLNHFLRPRYSDPNADPRHRTMESAIRWSFSTLSPPEQAVYREVALFPGGFSIEAAEAVCLGSAGGQDVPGCIGHLADKSLLNSEEDPFGDRRYRMLEPFREFARSESPEVRADTRAAFIAWYLELARSADKFIETDEQARWLERLDTEVDNIRLALHWTSESDPDSLPGFVFALRNYWTRRGNLREAKDWHARAISSCPVCSVEKPWLLNSMGALLWKLGDLNGAEERYAECLELASEMESRFTAIVRNNIAMLQDLAGRAEEARDSYLQNLDLFRGTGDKPNEATTLSNLGTLDAKAGNWELAVGQLLEALAIFEELGNVAKIARVRCNLAEAYWLAGRVDASVGHLASSFDCWRSVTDPHFMGEGVLLLAVISHELGDTKDALFLVLASEAVLRRCSASLGAEEAQRQHSIKQDLRLKVTDASYDRTKREAVNATNEAIVSRAIGVCTHLQAVLTNTNS